MHYKIYLKNPQSHYIYIDLTVSNITTNFMELHLPAWRPGRYELGNFAKNIKRVDAFDENKKPLAYHKTNTNTWHIITNGSKSITVTYSYYTSEINAGNCFADENQLYINPVHLCMYEESKINNPHVIDLEIPDSYKIIMNEFTRQDPTLPYLKDLNCPNGVCPSIKNPQQNENKIYYMKYDATNMKFVYICNNCESSWTSK